MTDRRVLVLQFFTTILLLVTMAVTFLHRQQQPIVNTTVCYYPVVCQWDESRHAVVARVEEGK